jgi:hypothetical protein
MDKFVKQENEKFTIQINFTNILTEDESISSYTLSAINNSTLADVESTIIDSSSLSNDIVYIKVKGGTNGTTYKLTILGTSSIDNVYEKDLLMEIVNL